jgi:hypothetical protein
MARPRKYASDADRQAARRQSDAARKRKKRAPERAARNALKNDPTKRKDAAVNAKAHPFAPVNHKTMTVIREIMAEAEKAGDEAGSYSPHGRYLTAMLLEWEDANSARLPVLQETTIVCGKTENGVPITYQSGEGFEWNKLCRSLRANAFMMERQGRNALKADRHARLERIEADEVGLEVADLRTRKDAIAKRKWEDKTQAEFQRAKSAEALAKRQARSDRDSTERMEQRDTFGRF